MKKILEKSAVYLALLVALVSGSLYSVGQVFAEENSGASMRISPVANSFNINAGDVQNYTFSIENTGSSSFSFKVYTAPYNVTDENYNNDFSKESSYNQITRWITFQDDSGSFVSQATYTVGAGEKKTIIYRVTVPDSIPEGGQYALIMAETVADEDASASDMSIGIGTVTRVGLILLGHGSGETNGTAEIVDYNLTGMFTSGDISASATVKNTGNTDFSATYTLEIKTLFNKTLYTNTESFSVLPETQRKFSTSWDEAPSFGVFKVEYKVEAADIEKAEGHVILILPIFVIVIMVLLLTSTVIWTIILLRKRKERSSRLVV